MSLDDLKQFALGLSIFKRDMAELRNEIHLEIKSKEAQKKRALSTV